eukprot:6201719-Pleurochrysis_carterae.AAC.1
MVTVATYRVRPALPQPLSLSFLCRRSCRGYDAHHFDSSSNCLHAAAMVLSFVLLFRAAAALVGSAAARSSKPYASSVGSTAAAANTTNSATASATTGASAAAMTASRPWLRFAVSLLWLPPIWYLYAWVGHLLLQVFAPA